MALINCPECGKEISDTAKSCPNCGYPLESNSPASDETEQPTASRVKVSVSEILRAHKKIVILIICLFIVSLVIFPVTSHDRYIDTLQEARYEMLMSGAEAEKLVNLTHDVWDDTIRKRDRESTAPYTHLVISGEKFIFRSDFNDSLAALYASEDTKEIIRKVEESRAKVDKLMHSLRNPSKEFEICYDTITDMYDSYCTYTDLASSPTGSLMTYTANANVASNVITLSYSRLEDQIPKKYIPI